jgi:hypothetical protein
MRHEVQQQAEYESDLNFARQTSVDSNEEVQRRADA